MNDQDSQMAMSAISHWAQMAAENVRLCAAEVASEQMRPCVLMRPAVSKDGDQWCALYGDNLQDGLAGFGDTPALAMADFDKNWSKP